jgi:predicted methyltransferase
MIRLQENTVRLTCRLGKLHHCVTTDGRRLIVLHDSLGITQFLVKSGIARLEEIRDADGTLTNFYCRV